MILLESSLGAFHNNESNVTTGIIEAISLLRNKKVCNQKDNPFLQHVNNVTLGGLRRCFVDKSALGLIISPA